MKKKFIILSVVLISMAVLGGVGFALNGYFGGGGTVNPDDTTRGLVGYWSFEDGAGATANDSSDQNNDLTLTNTPAWTTGKVSGALDFESGSSQYGFAADSASLSITGDLTATAWIKPESVTASTLFDIAGKWDGSNESYLVAQFGDEIRMYIDAAANFKTTDAANLAAGTWYYVAAVYDASAQTVTIYIDGTETVGTVTGTIPASIGDDTGRFQVGAEDSATTAANFYDGIVDEARLYNRALSAAEVKFLYNRGGPIAHWKLDEGSGSTAFDSAGTNDGTLTAMEETDWKQGQYGTALDFDGSAEYIRVTDSSTLSFGNSTSDNPFSVSAWINMDSANHFRILSKVGASTGEYAFSVDGNEKLLFLLHDDSLLVWISQESNDTLTADIGKWIFVTGTYDGSGTAAGIKLYKNGMRISSSVVNNGSYVAMSDTAEDIVIGLDSDGGSTFADGDIDDVRIYEYERTAEEIRLDYNAGLAARFGGSPNQDVARGLVGYWDFEDGAGTNANDSSDQNNDGTLTTMDPNTDWVSGKAGNGGALDFDGGNDYVDLVASDTLVSGDSSFTLSGWFNTSVLYNTAANEHGGRVITLYRTGSPSTKVGLGVFGDNTDTLMVLYHNGAFATLLYTNSNFNDGKWHYQVVTYDAVTNELVLYYDGQEVNSVDAGTISDAIADTAKIGTFRPSDNAGVWNGKLDDVRVYNRALSAAEVRYLYNQGEPVAHYKMDEGTGTTAFDSANITNDGAITGAAWTTGKFGTALDFDGTDDEISVTNADSIDFDAGLRGGVTFSAWIRPDSDGEGNEGRIVEKGANTYIWLSGESGGKIDLSGSIDLATTDASSTVSAILNTNQWHHVVMAYEDDGDDEISIYVDGKLVGTSTNGSGAPASSDTANLIIGGNSGTTGNFDGQLDDVRVYQYARTAEEIKEDYNAGLAARFGGSPNQDVTRGLVGYWDFEEGSGQSVIDQTDEGNDGTLGIDSSEGSDDPTRTSGKAGLGGALDFDGSADFVEVADSNSLSLSDGPLSFFAWINSDSISATQTVIRKLSVDYVLAIVSSKVWCGVELDDVNTGDTMASDTWYFIGCTYDGTTLKSYINGVEQGSTAATAGTDSDNVLNIGRQSFGNQYFNGEIDEVRIYNRALSAEEIRFLYNGNKPVLHLKFDEDTGLTAFDSAGTNNGALNAGMTDADWVAGKFDNALDFDGTNDIVEVADHNSLDLKRFTIAFWAKSPAAPGTSKVSQPITKPNNYTFSWDHTDSSFMQAFAYNTASTWYVTKLNSTLSANTWYHIVGTYDGTNLKAYLNGVEDASTAPAADPTSSPNNLGIGSNTAFTSEFTGQLDDVRIYNYALSAGEVDRLYNTANPTTDFLNTRFR